MLRLLIVPLTLIGGIALALETPPAKLVLQAERSNFYGTEQTSLIFEADRVALVTNSNFLQASPTRAVLGHVQSAYTDELRRSKAKIQEASSKKFAEKKRYLSPHEMKVSIGGRPLPVDSADYRAMLAVLEQALGLAEWKSVDALEVTPAAKGAEGFFKAFAPGESVGAAPQAAMPKRSECQEVGAREIVCEDPRYGHARLRRGDLK